MLAVTQDNRRGQMAGHSIAQPEKSEEHKSQRGL